ncbi:protein NipSnap homolog 3A-like [Ptychodera flava]|uniref:protein NipSnap homolog 3A-like n=1 Tax=Ptychodera flava TaxID=63121 RepID=UPI00396A730F
MFPLQHLKRLAKLQPLFSPGRYTLPSIQTAKNFSTTNQNGQVDKVYELRTYSIHPSKVTKFMQLTKENFHLRTNHSKLYGYWTSELGGLCEVVHIWEYDSFAHRTGVRKALSEDPEWISRYLSKMTKLIVKQDNIVLQAVPWHPVHETPLVEGSVYELRYYVMKPAVGMSWLEAVKAALESRAQKYDENKLCKIMGVWLPMLDLLIWCIIFGTGQV